MLKIHLQQGKNATLIAICAAAVILIMTIINIGVILPALVRVYAPLGQTEVTNPVDADTINRALDAVGG
jgi:hypothetical protein